MWLCPDDVPGGQADDCADIAKGKVMTSEVSPGQSTAGSRGLSSPSRLYARSLWAGLSIITMWLAVLFVGLFGGDFVSSSTTNGFTRIPVVVFLLPFVLPATIVVARPRLHRQV